MSVKHPTEIEVIKKSKITVKELVASYLGVSLESKLSKRTLRILAVKIKKLKTSRKKKLRRHSDLINFY